MPALTPENFTREVEQSPLPVIIDCFGPACGPCKALLPHVETLAQEYAGRINVRMLDVSQNPELCVRLELFSVPTLLFFKDGQCTARLMGSRATPAAMKEAAHALLLEGLPARHMK